MRMSILTIFVAVASMYLSCGAAPDTGPVETGMDADPVTTTSSAKAPPASTGDEKPPVDEKAEQAAAFCAHEVEMSRLQPPDMLNKKQITACLLGLRPIIRSECSKGVARDIVLKIIVDKTGDVSGAFPVGDFADSPEATCIAETVKGVKFPMFKSVPQQVIEKYPFKIEP